MERQAAAGDDSFDLVRSFLLAAAITLFFGMGAIGLWVGARIEEAASENAAAVAALRVDGAVAPIVQRLAAPGGTLDAEARRLLDERLARGVMSEDLFAFKIWQLDGTIAYASNRDLIGQRFSLPVGLARAAAGQVHTEFDQLADTENELERRSGVPLLEIYSPIRDASTGKVIAVVEFYDAAAELGRELREARLETWLVVGAVTAGMLGLISLVILRGGRLIAAQRAELGEKIGALSGLLAQNEVLRERADGANRRAASINERFLRRISADLHDGPMQLLGYASLRLTALQERLGPDEGPRILAALDGSVGELREISRGLALPELAGLAPDAAARRAIAAHRGRSDNDVGFMSPTALPVLPAAETICVYRLVQEGLANAERHAGGTGMRVSVGASDGYIEIEVADEGPGFDARQPTEGLGLSGLRERVAGLDGTFEVRSQVGSGTRLQARLPLKGIVDG